MPFNVPPIWSAFFVSQQSGRKERVEAAMPVLLETDTDIVLVTKKSPLRLKSVNEFEPESSLPLDANEFADTHEDFDMFRNGSAPHEANRCSNSSKSRDSIQGLFLFNYLEQLIFMFYAQTFYSNHWNGQRTHTSHRRVDGKASQIITQI